MGKIRTSDLSILEAIRTKQPISCTKLAEYFGISRQAMHLRLQRLERRGMIGKIPGAGRKPGLYYPRIGKTLDKLSGRGL